jgi:hypothetical protein
MVDKSKMDEELIYGTDEIALSLFEAWQCCYSECFTFDEYVTRVLFYLKDHFATIKDEIENADDEE